MNVHYINLGQLRNAGFTNFLKGGLELVTAAITGTDAQEIQPEMDAYTAAKDAVDAAYITDHASPHTAELLLLDERRDKAVVGLTFIVRGYTYSVDAAQKTAGDLLFRAIDVYGGIAAKTLQDESGALNNLIGDLKNKPDNVAAITTLSLSSWVNELSAASTAFDQKYLDRTAENAAEDSGPAFLQLRRNAAVAWSALRKRIDSLYIVHRKAAPWSTVVGQLNTLIDQYNMTLARRATEPAGGNNAVLAK